LRDGEAESSQWSVVSGQPDGNAEWRRWNDRE